MKKTCRKCRLNFQISESVSNFYQKIKITPPTICPDCRQQRRFGFRNERNLYQTKCSFCHSKILSMYNPDREYTVLCNNCYFSDKWDALEYSQEIDFNQPFFAQYNQLQQKVPKLNLQVKNCENCDYTNIGLENKNSYLLFGCGLNEDSYYCNQIYKCKNCMDCFYSEYCELCYELIDCTKCFKTAYSILSQNCKDSYFLFDCKRCSNCIGCTNLRDKEFYVFNKPLSKTEYKKFTSEELPKLIKNRDKVTQQILSNAIHKYMISENSENISGNFIYNSKNAENCFNIDECEDVNNLIWCFEVKDTGDSFGTSFGELNYECSNSDRCFNSKFCMNCLMAADCFYCDSCTSSKNLFGCIGVQHKNFCILNKEYSQNHYQQLIEKIIQHMQKINEWGEHFPIEISPFDYEETVANEYFPIKKLKSPQKEWKNSEISGAKTCISCQKPFKIIKQENSFYELLKLPIPDKCHNCRHIKRLKIRNPRKLFDRDCHKCHKTIKTSYSKNLNYRIYCNKCYLEEIY